MDNILAVAEKELERIDRCFSDLAQVSIELSNSQINQPMDEIRDQFKLFRNTFQSLNSVIGLLNGLSNELCTLSDDRQLIARSLNEYEQAKTTMRHFLLRWTLPIRKVEIPTNFLREFKILAAQTQSFYTQTSMALTLLKLIVLDEANLGSEKSA